MANQCTKFQVSSFSHSGDILGGNKNLNGSRDHNQAPFRDDLSFVCWDQLRFSSVSNLKSLRSLTTKILKATKNAKNLCGSGVRGHSRSTATQPFNRAHMTSYSTLIETMHLSCTVIELLSLISQKLKMSHDRDHAHSRDSL